jgi:hypothetical protein
MNPVASLIPPLFSLQWWQIFAAGISTLAIFSFLYRENRLFRIFEHFFIGIATAVGVIATVRDFFWPKVIKPMLGWDRTMLLDGSYIEPYSPWLLLYLLPISFGGLYYFIFSKRHSWLAQLVIGFSFGISAGLAFKGTFNELLPQLDDSYRAVIVFAADHSIDWGSTVNNWIFLVTLLSAMSYFFFTFRAVDGGVIARTAGLGRWLLMACFGAFFGSTIVARMALLVERLDFMINSWFRLF